MFTLASAIYNRTDDQPGLTKLHSQTITIIKNHLSHNPDATPFWPLLLSNYVSLKRFKEAEEVLQQAIDDASSEEEVEDHKKRLSQLYTRWAVDVDPVTGANPDRKKFVESMKNAFVHDRANPRERV